MESGHATLTRRPWLKFYGEMPSEIDYPDVTLYEALVETAAEYPKLNAYDFLGHRRSYRSLLAEVRRVGQGLWALGVRPGHRICTFLPNCPHLFFLLYAANRIGAVPAILDADAGPREARGYLNDLKPEWGVVSDEHLAGFQSVAGSNAVRGVVVASLDDYASSGRVKRLRRFRKRRGLGLGGLRGTVGVSTRSASDAALYELPPAFMWRSMRRLGIRNGPVGEHRTMHQPDEGCVILYTGGTSGSTGGVMLSDRNLDAAARQMEVQGPILAGQRVLSVVPFSHGLGLSVSVHTPVITAAESVIVPHFTARSVAHTIKRRKPDYLVGVPSFYAGLVMERKFQRTRLSFLMGAFGGGEKVSSHLHDAFEMVVRRRGGAVGIREGYGLTETVGACVVTPDAVRRAGSVGIPVADTIVRIVRPDGSGEQLEDLPADSVGEICVAGPTVMLGYVGAGGSARVHLEDGRRWLLTGDLGRMDEDGFIFFVERKGRSFLWDGNEVHPGVVEGALNSHPEVRESCVTVSEPVSDHSLRANIVPIDADLEPEWMETTLRRWCEQELDQSHRPAEFSFWRALPHTRLGVVDYKRASGTSPPRV